MVIDDYVDSLDTWFDTGGTYRRLSTMNLAAQDSITVNTLATGPTVILSEDANKVYNGRRTVRNGHDANTVDIEIIVDTSGTWVSIKTVAVGATEIVEFTCQGLRLVASGDNTSPVEYTISYSEATV